MQRISTSTYRDRRWSTRLAMVVPSNRDATLAEVLCAGWLVQTDSGVWASLPHILAERHRVLDDLLLKSAQVLEYHELIQAEA